MHKKMLHTKHIDKLEQEAPVCEEVRRERLTEAVQETEVQRMEEGLVIVTEAVQVTVVQGMVLESLVEGLLDDESLFVKGIQ